jgi:acetyl-CoA synthetase
VVGVSDELTGQAVNAFVSLKEGNEHNEQIRKDLVLQVRKTRSGKIMRRILRKILAGEEDQLGDISTVRLSLFRVDGSLTLHSFRTRLLWKILSPP